MNHCAPLEPHYTDGSITLFAGDCLDVLATLPDSFVDAVVTDPPYGLEFMGKDWDGADGFRRSLNPNDAGRDNAFGRTSRVAPEYNTGRGARVLRERASELTERGQAHSTSAGPYLAAGIDSVRVAGRPFQEWCEAWATECLRVLKPGGHMLAFGGTRTWHRLACAIEDAGFEVRDSIAWMYGSGFPKSLNLVGDDGERTGWGTALKPAHEPIVVARKPLAGTVAANVSAHGTGALNIDGCRVGDGEPRPARAATGRTGDVFGAGLASRFFYVAKADSSERVRIDGIAHPTVKPLSLMRWLVRLVTPPGGVVLEPFAGSGTTVEACLLEGFKCVAIEREADYLPLIKQRIHRRRDPVAAINATREDAGLFGLLDGGVA